MLRAEGWHWLTVGRHLERVLVHLPGARQPRRAARPGRRRRRTPRPETYGWTVLLRALSSYEAYRGTHRSGIDPRLVAAFLLLDPDLPPVRAAGRPGTWRRPLLAATDDDIGVHARRAAGRLRAELRVPRTSTSSSARGWQVLAASAQGALALHTALADTAFARGVPAEPRRRDGRA